MSEIQGETIDPKQCDDNFKERCRVCMSKKEILTCSFDNKHTVKQLEFCTGVLITKEDDLPKSICVRCRAKLTEFYEFKNLCIRSDELLRKLLQLKVLNQIKIKNEVSDDSDCQIIEDVKEEPLKQEESDYDDDFSFPEDECLTFEIPKLKPKKVKAKNTKKTYKSQKKKKPKLKKDKPKIKIDPLLCDQCDLKFTDTELLKEHKKKEHTFLWICEVCGKQFIHRSSHFSHVRSHMPPQYKCDSCDYSTWQKSDLVKHCRIHTGVKNYVCEYCTNSFHTTSNLHDHIRRHHTTRKPHHCPRCDRAFHDMDKLRRHVETTHDHIKRFECEVCHSQFARRCQWKQHMQKQHNLQVPRIRPGRRKANIVIGETPETSGIEQSRNLTEILKGNSSLFEKKFEENISNLTNSGEKSIYNMENLEESRIFIRNPEKSIFMGNPEQKSSILVRNNVQ